MVLLCFTVDMVLLWDGHRAAQLWPHVLNMAPAAAGNEFGQIGDGTVLPRMTAVAIASDIVSVSAGRRIYELRNCRWFRETLNIVEETCGQMWDHVANIPEDDLCGGWWHTLAVTATGEIFAWGQNKQGPSRTHTKFSENWGQFVDVERWSHCQHLTWRIHRLRRRVEEHGSYICSEKTW